MIKKYMSLAICSIWFITAPTFAADSNTSKTEDQPTKSTVNSGESALQHLPTPPDGFVWRGMRNALFLRPTSWNERSLAQNLGPVPTVLYASSAEDFGIGKQFETGFTLRIAYNIRQTAKMEASKLGLAMLSPIFQSHKKEDFIFMKQEKKGNFDLVYLRYRDAPEGKTAIIVHKFVLSNDSIDSSYEATFESPESSWDANWAKFGTPIIGKLLITTEAPN